MQAAIEQAESNAETLRRQAQEKLAGQTDLNDAGDRLAETVSEKKAAQAALLFLQVVSARAQVQVAPGVVGGEDVDTALLLHLHDLHVGQQTQRAAHRLRRDVILRRELGAAGELLPLPQLPRGDPLGERDGYAHVMCETFVFHRTSSCFRVFRISV